MRNVIKELEEQVEAMRKRSLNSIYFTGKSHIIEISSFPERWEVFFEGKTDMIKGIHLPDNSDAISCVYHAKKGSMFPKHIHRNAEENLFVVKGKMKVSTADGKKVVVSRGHSMKIPESMGHDVLFLEDTTITIVWLGEGSNFLSFDYSQGLEDVPRECKRGMLLSISKRHEEMVSKRELDEDELKELLVELDATKNTHCALYNGCHVECEYLMR